MLKSRIRLAVVIALVAIAATSGALPVERVIPGSPLTIVVGDDTSFQVLNAEIGNGDVGQIYPRCDPAGSVGDAGIMAAIAGTLYTPDFRDHPCSSSAALSNDAPWTPVSIGALSGDGSAANPFSVTVVVDAGSTGVRLTATYTYVNDDPFFRIIKVFTAEADTQANVYFGGDLLLAASDEGIPFLEPTSSSPGGRDCGSGDYSILFIPTTPADHRVAADYLDVWNEINTQGDLSGTVAGGACIDNGVALQWKRRLVPGAPTTITSAVSFGPIPPIVQFNVTSVSPPQGNQGQTLTVAVSGIGFQGNTRFDFGAGITVTSTAIHNATQATVTMAIAAAATPGPRDVTGTQSPGGLTATLVNGFTVRATAQCGRLAPARVLCTSDGSGDYLVTFRFDNFSTQTIQHIFLTGLPAGASAAPNYVALSPAVAPGGFATVGPIRIRGAAPGALTMTASIYNGELAHCCSFELRLELPDCGCGQLTEASGPTCRGAGGYTYTFSYQNLADAPIQQLLLAPDVPAGVTFSPNVILLNPPMQHGETRAFTTVITGAAAGQNVCFRIGAKGEQCDDCCSIRQCVFLPRCGLDVFDDVFVHGDTFITRLTEGVLTIESPSNEPDCTFPLAPGTTEVDLEWEPVGEDLPQASFIEQRYRGRVDGTDVVIAETRAEVTDRGVELRSSFDALGATSLHYVFRNDGRVVGIVPGVPPDVPSICNGCGSVGLTTDAHYEFHPTGEGNHTPASEEGPGACDPSSINAGEICLFAGYTFRETNAFALAALKFEADEVRVYPEDATARDVILTAVDFRAGGMPRITFTDLSVTVDCNRNGFDDLQDIATGASLDTDGNGVPDECQVVTDDDLVLSLSTGFDQERGVVLAGGADDGEWRILNPGIAGAAKVVRNPLAPWAAALPGSAWVSVSPEQGASVAGVTLLQFENCFCIGSGATSATLDLDVRADNLATVFLNGVQVSTTGGAFNGAPLSAEVTGAVGPNGAFRAGQNCLRVDVNDQGVVTGLNVAGSVRAASGRCDPP